MSRGDQRERNRVWRCGQTRFCQNGGQSVSKAGWLYSSYTNWFNSPHELCGTCLERPLQRAVSEVQRHCVLRTVCGVDLNLVRAKAKVHRLVQELLRALGWRMDGVGLGSAVEE